MRAGLVAVLVVALSAPALGASDDKTKLLVLDFKSEDDRIRPSALTTINGLVAAHVSGIRKLDVISSADVKSIMELEGEKAAVGCEDDTSCLAEVANAMGARLVIMGQMGRLGSFYVLNLSLFDSDEARTVSRRSVKSNNLDGLAVSMEPVLDEMAADFFGEPIASSSTTTTTTSPPDLGTSGNKKKKVVAKVNNKSGGGSGTAPGAKVQDVEAVRLGLASAAGGVGGGLGYAVGMFIGLATVNGTNPDEIIWPGEDIGDAIQNDFYAAGFSYLGTVLGAAYFNDAIGANITALTTSVATFVAVFGVWAFGALAGPEAAEAVSFAAMGTGAVVSIAGGAILTPMFLVEPDEVVGKILF